MSDLASVLREVAEWREQQPRQVVLRFPNNPGPIYDDVLIALQRLAERIEGQDEAAVVKWLRERGYMVTKR